MIGPDLLEHGLGPLITMVIERDNPDEAFDAWFLMIQERYKKHVFKMDIDKHPVL